MKDVLRKFRRKLMDFMKLRFTLMSLILKRERYHFNRWLEACPMDCVSTVPRKIYTVNRFSLGPTGLGHAHAASRSSLLQPCVLLNQLLLPEAWKADRQFYGIASAFTTQDEAATVFRMAHV